MKTCPDCKQPKPPEEFYRSKASKDGLSSYCQPCTKDRSKQSEKTRGPRNRREYSHRYSEQHPEKQRQYDQKRFERLGYYQIRYGLSTGDYHAVLSAQGSGCAICRRVP